MYLKKKKRDALLPANTSYCLLFCFWPIVSLKSRTHSYINHTHNAHFLTEGAWVSEQVRPLNNSYRHSGSLKQPDNHGSSSRVVFNYRQTQGELPPACSWKYSSFIMLTGPAEVMGKCALRDGLAPPPPFMLQNIHLCGSLVSRTCVRIKLCHPLWVFWWSLNMEVIGFTSQPLSCFIAALCLALYSRLLM